MRVFGMNPRASAVLGDEAREAHARARIEVLRGNHGQVDGLSRHDLVRIAVARVLSILWCRAHGAYQLRSELTLDSHLVAGPDLWSSVLAAVEAGRPEHIPIPAQSFVAWSSIAALAVKEGLTMVAMRARQIVVAPSELLGLLIEAAPELPGLIQAVESVWIGSKVGPVDTLSGRYLAAAVIRRHCALRDDWEPVSGKPCCPWLEIYQGPYRDATEERVSLLELLHPVLARSATYDFAAGALVALDQAASSTAQGDWEAQQTALRHAACLTDLLPSTSRWYGMGRIWCAVYSWRCGDVEGALDALRRLDVPAARQITGWISARSDARRVAEGLEARWYAERSLAAGTRAAWAHHEAGHFVRARDLGAELTARWPADGEAWAVFSGVLCAQSRFRDAKALVRIAIARGYDPELGQRLLERVQNGLCAK